jgi:hypothetical protein
MSGSERSAFLIVMNDTDAYGVLKMDEVPRVLYATYFDAKRALTEVVATFDDFIPVAYGAAYPYEDTTFEKEILKTGYATLGWVTLPSEDEEPVRIAIGLLKLPITDSQLVSS